MFEKSFATSSSSSRPPSCSTTRPSSGTPWTGSCACSTSSSPSSATRTRARSPSSSWQELARELVAVFSLSGGPMTLCQGNLVQGEHQQSTPSSTFFSNSQQSIDHFLYFVLLLIAMSSQGSSELFVPTDEHQPETFLQLQESLGTRLQSQRGSITFHHPPHSIATIFLLMILFNILMILFNILMLLFNILINR